MKLTDVNIKSPCTEKLDKPTVGCSGFYCKSCDRVVDDFRDVSEYDFNKRVDELGPKRCGIFYVDQISPEIYQPSSTPRLLRFALAILTLLGISTAESSAQSGNKNETENIVRDRQSHGLIPRYGLAIENEDATIKKHAEATPEIVEAIVIDEEPVTTAKQCSKRRKPRKILGIFPRKRRVMRGYF